MKLLVSRVRAILNRIESPSQSAEKQNNIHLDANRHTVIKGDEEIQLPRKEFALLELLIEHAGELVSREEIYTTIWGHEVVVGDRTIDVHIRKLRKKIGEEHIHTIKGVGYMYEK